ncbi:Major Facilitator Superfamily protein [Amycolatopsis arida]|uniref:Major Facilitator Superfamily protein n=2 Tax=Amycolatopsis arida TaxID=587909 RepID=A0A1I5ZG97_9PSEU|nr:MFS transporter [Amycolatopsis arida]SFQ55504.1 Major Facilitator Superfamily protein [Amycolatopsis arida]
MTMIAVPWFVLASTGSGAKTGMVAAAETVGLLVSLALAGPLIDRHGARRMSVLADLFTAAAVAVIPAAHAAGALSAGLLAVLAFAVGLGRSPSRSAKHVLLPEAMSGAGIGTERGTSAREAVQRAGDLVGAPAGGVLITMVGAAQVLLIDAAALLVSALLVLACVPTRRVSHHAPPVIPSGRIRGYLGDLAETGRRLRADRLLLAVTGQCAAMNALLVGLLVVLVPAYGALVWHSSALVGAVIAALGAGGLLGALIYGWFGPRLGRWATFSAGFLLCGPPVYVVLAVDPPATVLVALLALCSLGSGPLNPVVAALEYDRVPVELRGRVCTAVNAGAVAALPVGAVLAGMLLDRVGPRAAVLVFGALCLAVCLCPLLFPIWREMDRPAGLATPKRASVPLVIYSE